MAEAPQMISEKLFTHQATMIDKVVLLLLIDIIAIGFLAIAVIFTSDQLLSWQFNEHTVFTLIFIVFSVLFMLVFFNKAFTLRDKKVIFLPQSVALHGFDKQPQTYTCNQFDSYIERRMSKHYDSLQTGVILFNSQTHQKLLVPMLTTAGWDDVLGWVKEHYPEFSEQMTAPAAAKKLA